jgi:hypothetical protein
VLGTGLCHLGVGLNDGSSSEADVGKMAAPMWTILAVEPHAGHGFLDSTRAPESSFSWMPQTEHGLLMARHGNGPVTKD